MAAVEIISFGYLHGEPPAAHLTVDLRHHFRDPHINPQLRYMTADDQLVRDAVLATPGISALIDAVVLGAAAFGAGPTPGPVKVAFGCAGGRHRAATAASELAHRLQAAGHDATVMHRDLRKPVINR